MIDRDVRSKWMLFSARHQENSIVIDRRCECQRACAYTFRLVNRKRGQHDNKVATEWIVRTQRYFDSTNVSLSTECEWQRLCSWFANHFDSVDCKAIFFFFIIICFARTSTFSFHLIYFAFNSVACTFIASIGKCQQWKNAIVADVSFPLSRFSSSTLCLFAIGFVFIAVESTSLHHIFSRYVQMTLLMRCRWRCYR